MPINDSERCDRMVHDNIGFGHHRCTRRATHHEVGKKYCRIHSPSRIAERRAARVARFEKHWEDASRRGRLTEAKIALADLVCVRWRDIGAKPHLKAHLVELINKVKSLL